MSGRIYFTGSQEYDSGQVLNVARRIIHANGKVSVEFMPEELAQLFDITPAQLGEWDSVIPRINSTEGPRYQFDAQEEMKKIRHRLLILRTGVTPQQVQEIEKGGERMLQGYAAFAQDAPAGISAIVWRTYAIVVYTQIRYGKALNAEELALLANGHLDDIDPMSGEIRPSAELAGLHLTLLTTTGHLRQTPTGWEHHGLPLCMRGPAGGGAPQSQMPEIDDLPATTQRQS